MAATHGHAGSEALAGTSTWFAGGTGFDWVYILLASTLIGGLFLDGWAHTHGKVDQSFFTPWHAVLYSGFALVAAFLVLTLVMNHTQGTAWRNAFPAGYGSAVIGAAVFAVGGVGDLIWHTLFGIEKGIEGTISPSHLTLALGALLMFSGPLRAAWRKTAPDASARWVTLLPPLLALTSILSLLTFFTQYANPIVTSRADVEFNPDGLNETLGAVSITLQAAITMGVVLFAIRRWPGLPLGTFAILFGLNGFLMSFLAGSSPVLEVGILSALIGLLADLLNRALRPSAEAVLMLRIFAFAVPFINYVIYFAALLLLKGTIAWSVHVWTGTIVETGIVGLLLSYLCVPPRMPGKAT